MCCAGELWCGLVEVCGEVGCPSDDYLFGVEFGVEDLDGQWWSWSWCGVGGDVGWGGWCGEEGVEVGGECFDGVEGAAELVGLVAV